MARAVAVAARARRLLGKSRVESHAIRPVGFQKSVTYGEQRFHAARSYSLIKPYRTGRRLMRSLVRSATEWVG